MTDNLRPLRKCGKGTASCYLDVQLARSLALLHTRTALGWSQRKMALALNVSTNTLKRWESQEHRVDADAIETAKRLDPGFASVFVPRFEHYCTELLSRRAA